MVILHVAAPGAFGGLERVVQALARGQAALGHTVHVLAVRGAPVADDPFLSPLEAARVATHSLVVPARAYLRERAAVLSLCQGIRPDVVHTHGYRPDVTDAPVARRLGIPVVTTLHGYTHGGWRNWVYERVQYRAFRRFDAVVVVSRALVARLERAGVPAARIHTVPNAWSETAPPLDRATARRALAIAPGTFVVGWVGRLSPEKGPDILLEALSHLGDGAIVAAVVGSGTMEGALRARARATGVDRRVRWHGAVPDADRLFRAFDVFVLSSRVEGTPIVLFEAMAAGVPIVATAVGGVPDVVSPDEAALVPPEDARALAQAIRGVERAPGAAARRAQAARARLERDFSAGPWVERYEAVYRRVTGGVPLALAT